MFHRDGLFTKKEEELRKDLKATPVESDSESDSGRTRALRKPSRPSRKPRPLLHARVKPRAAS